MLYAKAKRLIGDLRHYLSFLEKIREHLVHRELERLKAGPRYQSPKSLIRFGYKVYSQNDEDGIIREIFSRIGTTAKTFVELGVGDGLENNTAALLLEGWTGLWIDASEQSIHAIQRHLPDVIQSGRLKAVRAFLTKDNIDDVIAQNSATEEIDLLSVDIDGNDYHVLHALHCVTPRVIVIEYNAKFPPPVSYCMPYDESNAWQGDDCFGSSLAFLETHIDGYRLVGCNITGSNAFFVRNDLVADHFLEPFTAENHYEPARYYLTEFSSGHPASYATLNTALPR